MQTLARSLKILDIQTLRLYKVYRRHPTPHQERQILIWTPFHLDLDSKIIKTAILTSVASSWGFLTTSTGGSQIRSRKKRKPWWRCFAMYCHIAVKLQNWRKRTSLLVLKKWNITPMRPFWNRRVMSPTMFTGYLKVQSWFTKRCQGCIKTKPMIRLKKRS